MKSVAFAASLHRSSISVALRARACTERGADGGWGVGVADATGCVLTLTTSLSATMPNAFAARTLYQYCVSGKTSRST